MHAIMKNLSKFRNAVVTLLLAVATTANAQNVLLINDNDNIVYNTDTIVNDLNRTIYSGYHYWSVPDSIVAPTAAYMANFDVIVWYCSTDGGGLSLWDGTNAGYADLITVINSGKPVWIIGQDILYQQYTAPATFVAGEFAKDYMGLTSYDVQSYVNDGSTGCAEVNRISGVSTLFPSTINWVFSTIWYIDGCTPQPATRAIYDMGPASYTLAGKQCMFHNQQGGKSVLSTFFDPALINTYANRVNFLEKGITYLLQSTGVVNTAIANSAILYPNPAASAFTLEFNSPATSEITIELTDALGRKVVQQKKPVIEGKNVINTPINDFGTGVYLVKLLDAGGNCLYFGKVSKM